MKSQTPHAHVTSPAPVFFDRRQELVVFIQIQFDFHTSLNIQYVTQLHYLHVCYKHVNPLASPSEKVSRERAGHRAGLPRAGI